MGSGFLARKLFLAALVPRTMKRSLLLATVCASSPALSGHFEARNRGQVCVKERERDYACVM